MSQSVGGAKTGEPGENQLPQPQAELGLSRLWPVRTGHCIMMNEWLLTIMKSNQSTKSINFYLQTWNNKMSDAIHYANMSNISQL